MRRANRYVTDIIAIFNRAGFDVTVHMTAGQADACAVVQRKAAEMDLIVCAGGDGTFNETVTGLLRSGVDVPIGYIPCGSTNDFAASLKLSTNVLQAARDVVEGKPQRYDVGKFNDRYFAYVAAFGAFTDVTYATPQQSKNTLGKLAYLVEGAQRLSSLKTYPIHLEYDGGETDGEFLVGLISNSSYVAGLPVGRWIDASMSDGLMEVTLVRKPNLMIELTRVASNLVLGELDPELIFTVKTKWLRITSHEPIPWTLDGEYGGSPTEVTIENMHRALTIHLPVESLRPEKP